VKRIPEALARFIERHPWWFIIIAVLLSAAAVPGITLLEADTGFNALVSPDAKISRDNARYQAQFGGESITVMLAGQLDDIFSPGNLATISEFEQAFSRDERYQAINSPLAILRTAQLQMGQPSLDDPTFIQSILYDAGGEISPVMQPFVPDDGHTLIFVTPQGNMSDEEALQATRDIENFFAVDPLEGVDTTVISSSKLVDAISNSMSNNIKILLGLSVAVMIAILFGLFRVRWRLLSLVMVGISALWTFGLMSYLSVPLTMATMAVLPILIGLGIDFSIQFHNRYQEEVTKRKTVAEAVITSISRMFPVVGIALLATIIGFITLYISEVPMIRDFGMVLAIGIIISYIVALFLLHSIVYLGDRGTPIKRLQEAAVEASGRIERILWRLGKLAINHTLWIFIVAVVFAAAGGIVDHWLPTNTDYEELMPQDTPALMELRELREIVGAGGTINFMVEADDVTSREVLGWLKEYQDEALLSHPELISTNSPATLVSGAAGGVIPTQPQIDEILVSTSADHLAPVLSADRRMASVSFSIEYLSLEEIHDLLQCMQEEAIPPAGVQISPVGTLVLGSSTMDAVVGSRLTMNLICLGAVFLILLLVYRRIGSTIFTIIPVGAVIAWSSLDMYLIGIPLNPLTAILGVLIIGICTEFMVLLMGRYDEEKRLGLPPRDAMAKAISKIGRAIVTTAMTTLGGFGVLIASNFVMIRDFGIATLLGVFLCLVITITVMPGLIVWYDNWRRRLASR
jgi:hydrophobe/amphiphile efflux-3 (HAE3) family protein